MSTLKPVVSFFPLFAAVILVVASTNDVCPYSKCTTTVSYPFRTPDQPATCGLPGFDLLCDIPNRKPLLSFPSLGHTFSVDSFWYYLNQITLSDPQGCLQDKLLRFDSSDTPFHFQFSAYFSLYNCSRSQLPNSYLDLEISCLSGLSYSVVCDKYEAYSFSNYGCVFIGYAKAPRDWDSNEFATAKSVDMSWDLPAYCQRCSYGKCQRDPNDLGRVICSASAPPPPPPYGSSVNSSNSSQIVLPIYFVAILVLSALLCLCAHCTDRRSVGQAAEAASNRRPPAGLEQDTLDTYPTIVVGGSGRMLANMEDKTCPICLSDYEAEESLKTLPECLHRFHADCLDEWLRVKALCPYCRTPPPRRLS